MPGEYIRRLGGCSRALQGDNGTAFPFVGILFRPGCGVNPGYDTERKHRIGRKPLVRTRMRLPRSRVLSKFFRAYANNTQSSS